MKLRAAAESVVSSYNGTLSGDASPHALAEAVLHLETILAAPDELAEADRLIRRLCTEPRLDPEVEVFLNRQER